jgi:hypothetical protein
MNELKEKMKLKEKLFYIYFGVTLFSGGILGNLANDKYVEAIVCGAIVYLLLKLATRLKGTKNEYLQAQKNMNNDIN